MSKEEFLQELERKLHVLNEQERRDVLEDYAQHIDLKIKNGQAEEEAVRSLGDPGELAAELFDVYHINSEYASDSHAAGNAGENRHDGQEDPAQPPERRKGFIRKLPGRAAEAAAAGREKRRAARAQKSEERRLKREAGEKAGKGRKKMDRKKQGYRQGRNVVSRALARFAGMVWTCILFFCKACLFGAALPALLLGVVCLFLGGVVLVLFLQGYPLAGIGIMTIGLTMSSFGLAALILSWVFTGKKRKKTPYGTAAQPSYGAAERTAETKEQTACGKEQDGFKAKESADHREEEEPQPGCGPLTPDEPRA